MKRDARILEDRPTHRPELPDCEESEEIVTWIVYPFGEFCDLGFNGGTPPPTFWKMAKVEKSNTVAVHAVSCAQEEVAAKSVEEKFSVQSATGDIVGILNS